MIQPLDDPTFRNLIKATRIKRVEAVPVAELAWAAGNVHALFPRRSRRRRG